MSATITVSPVLLIAAGAVVGFPLGPLLGYALFGRRLRRARQTLLRASESEKMLAAAERTLR